MNGQSCSEKILSIVQGVAELALDVASFVPGAQGLKAVSSASKAAKVASKAAKLAAKTSKSFAKQLAKKAKKEAVKRLKDAGKEAVQQAASGASPAEIADTIADMIIPGYGLAKEFVLKPCVYEH